MRSPVNLIDEEISRQVNLASVDELDGLTGLTINLEDHIPRSEFVVEGGSESLDDTIDRIIHENNSHTLLDVGRPTIIPDSLPPVDHQAYQTPVAASSSLSMSSVLRMSMRVRSSAEQQARFKRPTMTPLTAQGMRMRPIEAPSPCPNLAGSTISSSLFDDSSSQPDKPIVGRGEMPPLALFDLSGSLPPTAQLFPPSDSGTLVDYSFKTTTGRTEGSLRNSLLVPATQYGPGSEAGDVVDMAKLLPTTPTLATGGTESSVEIPPTQFPVSKAASQAQILASSTQILASNTQILASNTQILASNTQCVGAMSQVDLFAANLVNTQGIDESIPGTLSLTDPSIAPTFSPAIIVDQPIEVILEEPEGDTLPYSGHEMVMLPDSVGEEDDEDNPFVAKEDPIVLPSQLQDQVHEDDRQVYGSTQYTLVPTERSTQEPTLEVSLPTQDPTQERTHEPAHDPTQGPTQESVHVLEVPRTGKKVKFAPTPVDSSQPPPPMTVSVYRTRTDTQEIEEAFATSLTKFCQQVISVPRREMTPVKDVDERLMAEGDIQMKPKTPLKIVSRGATPIKPFASASKTLSRIIEAITPGKKVASSCTTSKVSSPCPRRKATPTAKRTLPTPKKSKESVKKQKTSPLLAPAVSESTVLGEGLLVWAHWRLQYFTAGIVEKKKSIRREVWQIRPFHRSTSTLDLSADHFLPLVLLQPGDTILHITDRRSYKTQKLLFSRFVDGDEEGEVKVEVEGGEQYELKDVIIDRTVFVAKHKEWKASFSNPPSSDPCIEMEREDTENQEPNVAQGEHMKEEDEVRYSLTGTGFFTGLQFVITGSTDKNKLTSLIEEAGGSVIEELTPDSLPDLRDLILISTDAQPCRTAKYYCAVLLGLERLKAGWIEASLCKGKLVPFGPYRLPPKSPATSNHTASNPVSALFTSTHLSFIGSKSFKSSCTLIASFTSATLIDPRRLSSLKDRTVVVVLETGEALTPRLQATCLANGHVIVEKAWFTDSILQGRVLPLS